MSLRTHTLAAALIALAAPASQAAITGTMFDAQSQQPIAIEAYPNVILFQCLHDGDTFCTGFAGFAEADSNGGYTIDTTGLPAGRYQLLAGASDYSYHYSTTFDLTGSLKQDLGMTLLPFSFSDVTPCTTVDAAGFCRFEYTLTNRSAAPMSAQVWASVIGHTNMPATDSTYMSGDGSFDPLKRRLAAGEARRITQSVFLGVRDAGSASSIGFYAAPVGQPNNTVGFFDVGQFTDAGSGTLRAQHRSARIAAALAGPQARRATSTSKAATPALTTTQADAQQAATYVGRLLASDTHAPLPLSLYPRMRLVTCAEPTDEFCNKEGGEFVYLDESGRYYLRTAYIVPGRYQIEAQAFSGYGLARSPAFDAPGAIDAGGLLNLVLPTPLLAVGNVSGCDMVDAVDGSCTLSYDVTNTSKAPQTLSVWLRLYAYLSGSDVGVSTFVAGDTATKMTPKTVALKSGETLRLTQKITLGKALRAGSEGEVRVYVGRQDDPSYADSFTSLGYYLVSASGSVQRRAATR